MKKIAIIGASGHGKVAADVAAKMEYESIVFLDDDESVRQCGDYPVVGKSDDAESLHCDVFVAIGNTKVRHRIQKMLEDAGVPIVTLIHPDAVIAEDVRIGKGSVIMAGTVINPGTVLGEGCIVNTCASVDHDCTVGDYVHIAVGAHLCGTVEIGEDTWIGAGAIVSNNLYVCPNCMIGAGAVVIRDIQDAATYVGVPAKKTACREVVRE